ncbi:MAG TPA: nicotinate (nicotinamide) nucleotide adenylyltransferase [Bacillota bacterium]|nr:nicotinate (nicotinamide) nucleotide adenylyltransferase [Bacillota bacterium]
MRIGIYGSSFDPVTNVHLWTASTVANRVELGRVIFLPCSSKRTDKLILTADHHRLEMLQLAVSGNPLFMVDPYEINRVDGTHYTYSTLKYFKQKYPEDDLFFIIGADLLAEITSWKFGLELVQENQFIVMARDGIDMLEVIAKDPILRNNQITPDKQPRFHLLHKGLNMEISSTYIREEFAMGGEPRYLLPDSCYQYIINHSLYQRRK